MKALHIIRLAPWVDRAVSEWRENNKRSFQGAVSYLLECELNSRGYLRRDFEPGIVDARLEDTEFELPPGKD
jgi:hypothetical protein